MKGKHLVLLLLAMSFFSTCADHENLRPPAVDDKPAVEDTIPEDDPVVEDSITIYYEDNEAEGTVAYKPCADVGEDSLSRIYLPKGKAYYFKDSIPERLKDGLQRSWVILYETKTGEVSLDLENSFEMYTGKYSATPIHGRICNFPDFAKAWDVPEDGCKIYFEGIDYPSIMIETSTRIQIDYVLTILRKNDGAIFRDFFIYYNGQKLSYKVSETNILVKSDTLDVAGMRSLVSKAYEAKLKDVRGVGNGIFRIEMQNTSWGDLLELHEYLNGSEDVVYTSPVLLDELYGDMVGGYVNEVLVRILPNSDVSSMEAILNGRIKTAYQIESIAPAYFDERAYKLTLKKNARKDAMQVSHEIYETGLFEYAEPNFILFVRLDDIY
ncbi:MAG: hypothetical protein LBJ39_05680 [Tannerellaceae bacterium]|jgi:hypothetical protein|nr:hypothetical protein [Tannerellaceae bacterium]